MAQFHVRPLEPESDLAPLIDLLTAIRRAEGNPTPATADELRPALAQPRFHRWVALEPGGEGLIGLAVLFHQTPDRCYGDIRVHPAWRRRGVGRTLSDALAAGAGELGTRFLAIDVAADNQEALRFLLSQGFRFRGDVWALEAPAEIVFDAPQWPPGYVLEPFADSGEFAMLADLKNRTFSDLWGHWENTPGLVTEETVRDGRPPLDESAEFVVYDENKEGVGQCRVFPPPVNAPTGAPHVIDQPGVVPSHRSAGLHVPLLQTAARWLQEQRGRQPIRLESWGDDAATIALYEALGFALIEHEVSYVREVGR
jgi:ribosomal protein S18 acetylase RimI-like enzyme